MVVAEEMSKAKLKVSVSNSESSSDESEEYDAEVSDAEVSDVENQAEFSDVENQAEFSDVENQAEGSDIENQAEVSDVEIQAEVSDADNEENSDSNPESDDDLILKNEGWADSISKILGTNKPKNKKTLVLSRAKKLADVVKREIEEKPAFEIVGEEPKEKKPKIEEKVIDSEEPPVKKKKTEKSTARIRPNILEKDRERLLTKIATKGVVQLFNAVRNQQKTFESELSKDLLEGKKEKILKKFDKRAFLDTLMGQSKSIVVDENTKPMKDEAKSEEKPRWNALRDDFMMGAKMKDWDKEVEE